jgi:hypothetical protein
MAIELIAKSCNGRLSGSDLSGSAFSMNLFQVIRSQYHPHASVAEIFQWFNAEWFDDSWAVKDISVLSNSSEVKALCRNGVLIESKDI